jgi:hypothetical protein
MLMQVIADQRKEKLMVDLVDYDKAHDLSVDILRLLRSRARNLIEAFFTATQVQLPLTRLAIEQKHGHDLDAVDFRLPPHAVSDLMVHLASVLIDELKKLGDEGADELGQKLELITDNDGPAGVRIHLKRAQAMSRAIFDSLYHCFASPLARALRGPRRGAWFRQGSITQSFIAFKEEGRLEGRRLWLCHTREAFPRTDACGARP